MVYSSRYDGDYNFYVLDRIDTEAGRYSVRRKGFVCDSEEKQYEILNNLDIKVVKKFKRRKEAEEFLDSYNRYEEPGIEVKYYVIDDLSPYDPGRMTSVCTEFERACRLEEYPGIYIAGEFLSRKAAEKYSALYNEYAIFRELIPQWDTPYIIVQSTNHVYVVVTREHWRALAIQNKSIYCRGYYESAEKAQYDCDKYNERLTLEYKAFGRELSDAERRARMEEIAGLI